MTDSGYSGTPLVKKLGIKTGYRVLPINPPGDYLELLAPLPDNVLFLKRSTQNIDVIHFFTDSQLALQQRISGFQRRIQPDGMIWVSWPKKASGIVTDMNGGVIRDVCLPLGLVDVKICAVDAVWSGLKLVIRKALR